MRGRIAPAVDVRQPWFHTESMAPKLFLACCLLAVSTGCLMSEQIGEPVGRGNSRVPGKDVAIHFDTDFNRILMFGRSAALAGIAFWMFSSWGAKPVPAVIGTALLVASGWLVVKDYPALKGYRLEVAPDGLTLKVPPDLDTLVPYESIEALELEGFGYSRIGGGPQFPSYGVSQSVALELPDWKTMKLTLTGGEEYTIVLGDLSIEHRQIFAKALIKRAGLVEMD